MKNMLTTVYKAISRIRKYYLYIISAFLVLLSVVTVYRNDLKILLNEALRSDALSHVLLIPFFSALLLYLKTDMVKAQLSLEKSRTKGKIPYIDEAVGVALCLIAFLLYWYGSYTFYPLEFHLFSLPIFVMGVILILFNYKVLVTLLLPILFLFFLVPPPTEFTFTLGGTLASFSTQTSYTILATLGLPVTLSSSYGPPTIDLITSTGDSIPFTIDLPCSGIYSLIAFAMVASFLALIATTTIPRKLVLLPLGFAIFVFLNIFRITAILSIGYWFGIESAMLIFHTVAGLLLIFTGMIIILFIAKKILKIQFLPQTQKQLPCPECEEDSVIREKFCLNCGRFLPNPHVNVSQKFWVKLFLLILGCSLVTLTVHAPTFAIAQNSIEVTSGWQESTNLFPSSIVDDRDVNYTLYFLCRDTYYERISGQDASIMYAYYPPLNQQDPVIYVDLGVADSISNLHNWEVCLVAIQTSQGKIPLVSVLNSRKIQLIEDPPVIASYLVFKDHEGKHLPPNYTQVTLYWYEKATFKTGITVEQKYTRISLIILTQNSTLQQQLEDQLFTFGQEIASYWEPLKTQSLISLGVSAQQLLLVFSIGFVTFTKTAEHLKKMRDRENNQKIFDRYASPEEKLVLQTIQELVKHKKKIEPKEINTLIRKNTGKTIKTEKLHDILKTLENHEFIKREITSNQNTPKLIWKTQLSQTFE